MTVVIGIARASWQNSDWMRNQSALWSTGSVLPVLLLTAGFATQLRAQTLVPPVEARGAMEGVDGDELLRRVRNGDVTVLDVRPTEEYRAGHIPGALSVPLPTLKKRLQELPRSRAVVA